MGEIDLHIHSNSSDGSLSPDKIIEMAVKKGLKIIAITDHNTEKGSKEAVKVAAGRIKVIPGIEIATHDEARKLNLDILGYNIKFDSKGITTLIDAIESERMRRINIRLEQLQNLGVNINFKHVLKHSDTGYVSKYTIIDSLHSTNFREFADDETLLDPKVFLKAKTKFKKRNFHPKEAIKEIIEAGGIPVIAHVCDSAKEYNESQLIKMIREYKSYGLRGIEVYHSRHNEKQIKMLTKIAKAFGMLVTGGSDFHNGKYGGEMGKGIEDPNLSIFNELNSIRK